MKKGPCYGCTERFPACHGSCERYAEWRRPLEIAAAERVKGRQADELLCDGHYRGWKKYRKGERKK